MTRMNDTGRVILVRHGETDANRRRCFADSDEIPLTDAGRQQAEQLARRLSSDFRPQRVAASPFVRARQTGEIIARELGLAMEITQGIHERDFGCLKGHPYERMGEQMCQDPAYDVTKAWLWRPAGGESLDDVRVRAVKVLDALRAQYPAEELVLVCHGAVIQSLCAHMTGVWGEVPSNCGIVVVAQGERGWEINEELSDLLPAG
jgi:broad specificity phosphatase PhoE